MTHPAYPAARIAAGRVHSMVLGHRPVTACVPEESELEALIDAAFWASLRREESFVPRLSLAFVRRELAHEPMMFERPLPLWPAPLARIAPAVERPGIHLGVASNGTGLEVWGTCRELPPYSVVLEVVAPGLLVIKQSPAEEQGKYANLAVLQGDVVKIIDQAAVSASDCPELIASLLGFDSHSGSSNILIQLAVSMRAHGRGGLLLVVPAGSSSWRCSIMQPIAYAIVPPFRGLAELALASEEQKSERSWQDALRRTVDSVGGLTAVDGATIIDDQFEVLAFGAKIIRQPKSPPPGSVIVTEPVEGSTPETVEATEVGGTRHLAAAQFAQDQPDAMALVASQDGRFTVFAWSPSEGKVHAHRIDVLLM